MKEKASNNSSSSKGSHALLDLSFLDHFARVEEKTKEPSKSPYLQKMFPCKIPILPPTDSDLVSLAIVSTEERLVSLVEQTGFGRCSAV